jgi:RNA polymerase sigma factor (TIGR02999 family)
LPSQRFCLSISAIVGTRQPSASSRAPGSLNNQSLAAIINQDCGLSYIGSMVTSDEIMGPKSSSERRDTRFASLYAELRDIAKRELRRAGANASLSPTTVLHEAYLKLQQRHCETLEAESDFLPYAARVMRNLVIDMFRHREAIKRGGGFEITTLETSTPALVADASDLQSLGDAIDALSKHDPELAQLVDLKFFCGFSFVEIAGMREVSDRTVQRDWEKARLLLRRLIDGEDMLA